MCVRCVVSWLCCRLICRSCRFDAEDLLEKRVLSRFSRRKLYLYNTVSYTEFADSFKKMLTLPGGFADEEFAALWGAQMEEFVQSSVVS